MSGRISPVFTYGHFQSTQDHFPTSQSEKNYPKLQRFGSQNRNTKTYYNTTQTKMTVILLSCNADEYDKAQMIQIEIEEELGFTVIMDVEDYQQQQQHHHCTTTRDSFEALDSNLKEAAELLVFQFIDCNISAWVMIEDDDEWKPGFVRKEDDDDDDFFPECVNFSNSIEEGMAVFEDILKNDLGLAVRPPYLYPATATKACSSSSNDKQNTTTTNKATTTSISMPTMIPSDPSRLRVIGRVSGLISKFKCRLSL